MPKPHNATFHPRTHRHVHVRNINTIIPAQEHLLRFAQGETKRNETTLWYYASRELELHKDLFIVK